MEAGIDKQKRELNVFRSFLSRAMNEFHDDFPSGPIFWKSASPPLPDIVGTVKHEDESVVIGFELTDISSRSKLDIPKRAEDSSKRVGEIVASRIHEIKDNTERERVKRLWSSVAVSIKDMDNFENKSIDRKNLRLLAGEIIDVLVRHEEEIDKHYAAGQLAYGPLCEFDSISFKLIFGSVKGNVVSNVTHEHPYNAKTIEQKAQRTYSCPAPVDLLLYSPCDICTNIAVPEIETQIRRLHFKTEFRIIWVASDLNKTCEIFRLTRH